MLWPLPAYSALLPPLVSQAAQPLPCPWSLHAFPPSPLLRVLSFLECPLSSSTSRISPDQSSKTPVKVSLPLKTSLKAPAVANFVSLWREGYGLYHTVQHYFMYVLVLLDDVSYGYSYFTTDVAAL